jgi:hypothetical protein
VWLIGRSIRGSTHLYDVRTYTPPAPPATVTPHASNEQTNYLTIGFTLERAEIDSARGHPAPEPPRNSHFPSFSSVAYLSPAAHARQGMSRCWAGTR